MLEWYAVDNAATTHLYGIRINLAAFWVGWQYNAFNRCLFVQPFPCVTFWWVRPGGFRP
jgi:hypothetical protein